MQPPHQTGGVRGCQAPPVPVYASLSDCVTCVALRHLPCSTTLCCARVCPRVVRRRGIDDPWQADWRSCLLLDAWYTPFAGQFLRIASIAVACGWMVEMGHPDMGRRTTSGEGRGAAQETETRRRHPSRLAVVLPRNWAGGLRDGLLVAIV